MITEGKILHKKHKHNIFNDVDRIYYVQEMLILALIFISLSTCKIIK